MLMLSTVPLGPVAREWRSASMCAFLCGWAGGFPVGGSVGITSVRRLVGAADVLGGEDREDVRLQRLDKQLEAGKDDGHQERCRGEQQPDARADQIPGRDREHRYQDVPR